MFLYISDAKGLKIDEKRVKFAELAVSVPELSKVVKTSLWLFKTWKIIIKSPWGFTSCQNKSFKVQICKMAS